MFSASDLAQFQEKGIAIETVNKQLQYFEQGFPFTEVVKAATIGDGILRLDAKAQEDLLAQYEAALRSKQVCKFVPASGAASRMFKAVFAFIAEAETTNDQSLLLNQQALIRQIIQRLPDFAFYDELKKVIEKSGTTLDELLMQQDYARVLKFLLTDIGLNYGQLPKGLLQFHEYENSSRTPVEEHLVEGANYCRDTDNTIHLHFTVSKEHQAGFEELIATKSPAYERKFAVRYAVEFSQQQPYTDTIAVDMENQPFRLEDGSILFRPGGHGALIENLNAIDADIVFIKNIDNVVPDSIKADTYQFKKVIAGVLVATQQKVFDYLERLDTTLIPEVEDFLIKELSTILADDYTKLSETEKFHYLRNKLDRPIRVCGMVKNEGEPGGGPFWAKNPDSTISLHIVESAQFDKSNNQQMDLMRTSSHFNPVDIVCTLKNHKGEKFDLTKYVNTQQGFIANKSKNGRALKALELPGLWNGAMADWNTIFVEVPITTFSPVKTINDLLRPTHQP